MNIFDKTNEFLREVFDANGDGNVTFADIDPFLALMGNKAP